MIVHDSHKLQIIANYILFQDKSILNYKIYIVNPIQSNIVNPIYQNYIIIIKLYRLNYFAQKIDYKSYIKYFLPISINTLIL